LGSNCLETIYVQKKQMRPLTVLRSVMVALVVASIFICLTVTLVPANNKRFGTLVRSLWLSLDCTSFHTWAQMIQHQPFLSFTDHSTPGTTIPSSPHIILCNHIASHARLGSAMTVAGSIQSPSNVVCYQNYEHMGPISKIVHPILRTEICIDVRLGPTEKETRMIDGIRASLASGRNVVMFVDVHCSTTPMRSLNRKVLGFFPGVPKQLVHLMEPTGINEFHFRRLPSTMSLTTILSMRESILIRQAKPT
jgi:hypothetical protein